MKDSSDTDGVQPTFNDPLPGDATAWRKCTLGPIKEWPDILRAHAQTISNLPYPAAVFWGDDYVLVHNQAWDDEAGIQQQGLPQKDSLPLHILQILRSVTSTRLVKEIQSRDLIPNNTLGIKPASIAVLSPLLQSGKGHAEAILVQLLPKPMPYQSLQLAGSTNSGSGHGNFTQDVTSAVDNMAIDEHPFFRRFAEMIPSGLAILDRNAQAVFVNQHFYNLTTHRSSDKSFTSWPQSIHPDDYDRVMNAYQEAFKSQKQLRTEFRAMGAKHPWRLLLLTPLEDENLQHVSLREYGGFICSIVDITSEKSAEISEREAAKQARERKEQQERFIDMISHEIRNPLSAVLHCAEEIGDAIRDKNSDGVDVNIIREAVDTIHLCVTHQKNIVDDVLSFSKLDASLLSLVPRPSQPDRQLANTLKMFQHEFRKEHLGFDVIADDSYTECKVDWVLADMARVSQVVINLITNAIKFTHHVDGEKQVHCLIGASKERPTSYPRDVVFFESDATAYRMDATGSNEWGHGDALYITVAVKDTGIGISDEGQKRLFERFRQATPKTEEVYGGSGLGLNISRKICHLHGGEIGVSSKEGKGSTFAFYFRVRRMEDGKGGQNQEQKDEEEEGDDRMRDQIHDIKSGKSENRKSRDPFEWTPGEKKRPGAHRGKGSKSEQIDSLKAPANEDRGAEGADEYERAKRPSLSNENQSSGNRVSLNVGAPGSPGVDEPNRAVMTFNQRGERAHVLLVEDNVINQKIVFRQLEAKGFNVTTANNGQEAVDAAKNAPRVSSGSKAAFDVILMDMEMPIMDGNSATKAIHQHEKDENLERVPILGVTANVRGAQQEEMKESGMDDVMSKPYKIDDLVAKINEVAAAASRGSSDGRKTSSS